jgi:hypothetical protein
MQPPPGGYPPNAPPGPHNPYGGAPPGQPGAPAPPGAPPPYQAPPYGFAPPGYAPQPSWAPHRGALILVLGILGLMVCGFLGIAAWVMGNNDLAEMEAGRMDPSGREMTNIGKILGIVTVAFWVLGILIGAAFFIFGIAMSGFSR